ncbi:MAG TPA: penicillin-binding protein, partial [Nocardioides sp.]|nr:penicillin-binding protein [Nocardioides sp.]
MTKKPQRPHTRGDRAKKVGKVVLIIGLVCSLLGVAAFAVAYAITDIPDPNEDFQTQTSFVYYSDGRTELGRYATQNRESISLDEMP